MRFKKLFSVYIHTKHGRKFIGSTAAVSQKQAINNVRHNVFDNIISQYDGSYYWETVADDAPQPVTGEEYDLPI